MTTVRLKFEKTDYAIFYSNLDLQRVFQRAMKKSGMPVHYSNGYNPRIYLSFTLPLSLGHASLCECCDFKLENDVDEEIIISSMQPNLPEGITIKNAKVPAFDAHDIAYAKYEITVFDDNNDAEKCVADFMSADSVTVIKSGKKGDAEVNIKPLVSDIEIKGEAENSVTFTAVFPAGSTLNINPNLMLGWMSERHGIDAHRAFVKRLEIRDNTGKILE